MAPWGYPRSDNKWDFFRNAKNQFSFPAKCKEMIEVASNPCDSVLLIRAFV